MNVKKEHYILALIFLVGLIARIIKIDDPSMVMDTVAFSRLGKNLIEGGRYVFGENYNMGIFFPPGYPILIGMVNLAFNDLFLSAKVVSLIASGATIILAYFLGKELYNREAGLFAALVYAIYPVILIISVDAYADALFFGLMLLAIYLFIISLKRRPVLYSVLFGLTVAYAFLTRPEGMFLLLLPGLQLFGVFSNSPVFNRKSVINLFLILALFVALISPYMLYIKSYTGKFSMSGKGNVSMILGELSGDREYHDVVNAADNLYDRAAFTLTEDKTQLRGWNRNANFSMKDYLLNNPAHLIKRYQKNVMREISTLIKLLIPIALPLFFSFFNRELFSDRRRLIFLMYPAIYFLLYPLFIIIEKQTLVIAIYLIFFSSGGFTLSRSVIAEIAGYYGLPKNRGMNILERSIKYIIIFILVLSSVSYLKYSSFDNVPMPLEHKRAGLYLKEKLSAEYEELNIMARKPYVNYYSGARFTMIPYAGAEDIVEFARLYDVDFIVIDDRALIRWESYDELRMLDKQTDSVELFYEDTSEAAIRIFKLLKE